MTDQEAIEQVRVSCLEIAAMRNQKLLARASDIVAEAEIYTDFVINGVPKSKRTPKS